MLHAVDQPLQIAQQHAHLYTCCGICHSKALMAQKINLGHCLGLLNVTSAMLC